MDHKAFTLILVLVYFASMIAVGFYYRKKENVSRSSDDYILAGRRAPLLIVAGSFFATIVSTGTLVGYAGSGYSFGISAYWSGGVFMTASMFAGLWVVPRLRALGITTVPQIFEKYFGAKHRVIALILSLGRDLGVTASILLVLGQIFNIMFGLPFLVSVAITAGVVIVFVFARGTR